MSILVTGGCGFIGARLVAQLLDDEAGFRVLDDLSRGRADNLPSDVELVRGDIRDSATVAEALAGVDTVIHLAAYGSVIESISDPLTNFDINARGTLVLLRGCVDAGVERFLLASTGGALIGNAEPPVDESNLPWPISPYGASKLCGEAYLHAFAGAYGLRTAALRFANVYGPFSDHKKGAVTTFIKNALLGEPIVIYGDGSASRDFLYVDDLCSAIRAAVAADLADEVIHVASESETTIRELAELILRLADREDLEIEHREGRRGEVGRNFATAAKARRILEFAPAETLESGMAKTINWFSEHRSRWHGQAA
jgi:UDP-glucose 4-epimerase